MFKFYNDGPKKQELSGTIDFDIIICDLTIEEDYFISQCSSIASHENTEGNEDNDGPTKFKIEVADTETIFIFDAQNNTDLQSWSTALFQNWAAGEAMQKRGQIHQSLSDKWWQ